MRSSRSLSAARNGLKQSPGANSSSRRITQSRVRTCSALAARYAQPKRLSRFGSVVTDEATSLALVIIRLAGTLPEDETGNSYMESQWLFSLLQASTFQPGVSWLTLDNAE